MRVKHACEVFASFPVGKEGLAHVADEDKRAWDDGEGEVGVRDEVGDILLEGGETKMTEQTSSPKKPHHQPLKSQGRHSINMGSRLEEVTL